MPVNQRSLFCAGTTPAIHFAAEYLSHYLPIVKEAQWDCGHLLLDVPSFRPGSIFSDDSALDTLLSSLPPDVTVWGGGLNHPALSRFSTVDLLRDASYLMENAAITAHCAINIASQSLPVTLQNCPILISGWGRIGKHLARLLTNLGATVFIAVRNHHDKIFLQSLNYRAFDYPDLEIILPEIRVLFNTVPEMVFPEPLISHCKNCIKIDLASKKGIAGSDVIWARGLPGIHAPESSGVLIGKTILRLMKEERV